MDMNAVLSAILSNMNQGAPSGQRQGMPQFQGMQQLQQGGGQQAPRQQYGALQAIPGLPTHYDPNAGFLKNLIGGVGAFLAPAMAPHMEPLLKNNLMQQQLASARTNNQFMPLLKMMQQQVGQSKIDMNNQHGRLYETQAGLEPGKANAYMANQYASASQAPHRNALADAQMMLANRNADAPFSDAGKSIQDYSKILSQYGKDSPQAAIAKMLMQNKIKTQNTQTAYTRDGMPVPLIGGQGGMDMQALLNQMNGGQQQSGGQSPIGMPQQPYQQGGMPQQPDPQGGMPQQGVPDLFLKDARTGGRNGAGSTYVNMKTGEKMATPTNKDVGDMQSRLRAIDQVTPLLEELKALGVTGTVKGAPYIGNNAAKYNASLNEIVDKYVVAASLPKTDGGILTAREIVERKTTESDSNYKKRIDEKIKNLENAKRQITDTLDRGYIVKKGTSEINLSQAQLLEEKLRRGRLK